MANRLNPHYRESCLVDPPDLTTVDVVAIGMKDYSEAAFLAHEFLADVPDTGERLSTTAPLTGITVDDGVFDAADATLPAVPDGETITSLLLVADTGNEATSRLLARMDQNADGTPISFTGGGADVLIRWSSAATRLFKL